MDLHQDILDISIQNYHLPLSLFAQKLGTEFRIIPTQFNYLKLFSAHCILNLFEFYNPEKLESSHHFKEVLPKTQAYDCYLVYFTEFYRPNLDKEFERVRSIGRDLQLQKPIKTNPDLLNIATFGKLIKSLYYGKVESRRIGGRARSKYCFSNLRIRPDALAHLKQNGVNIITYQDINDYQVGEETPTESQQDTTHAHEYDSLNIVRSRFKTFLENDMLIPDNQPISNERSEITQLLENLQKSELLLNNFIHSTFSEPTNLELMCEDWERINVLQIIKESIDLDLESDTILLYDLTTLVNSFKLIFQQRFIFNEDCIYKFFKINSISFKKENSNTGYGVRKHADLHAITIFKNNVTQFLLKIIPIFQNEYSSRMILLNFKFITTKILRALTTNRCSSFSSYWIFSCFVDEYFNFLVQFSNYYKRPNTTTKLFSYKKRVPVKR